MWNHLKLEMVLKLSRFAIFIFIGISLSLWVVNTLEVLWLSLPICVVFGLLLGKITKTLETNISKVNQEKKSEELKVVYGYTDLDEVANDILLRKKVYFEYSNKHHTFWGVAYIENDEVVVVTNIVKDNGIIFDSNIYTFYTFLENFKSSELNTIKKVDVLLQALYIHKFRVIKESYLRKI